MSLQDQQKWNGRYEGADAPSAPKELLVDAVTAMAPGRALDVACGLGGSTLWLAQQGWSVDAIDISSVAIDLLREAASGTEGNTCGRIDARVHDLDDGLPADFAGPYDLVLCLAFRAPALHEALRSRLAPGALLVTSALSVVGRDAVPSTDGNQQPNRSFLAEAGELSRWAAGLEILVDREADGLAELVARNVHPG